MAPSWCPRTSQLKHPRDKLLHSSINQAREKNIFIILTNSFMSVPSSFRIGFWRKLLITFSVRLPKEVSLPFEVELSELECELTFPYPYRLWDVWSGSFLANCVIFPNGFWIEDSVNMLTPLCKDIGRAPWPIDKLGAIPSFVIIFINTSWEIWHPNFR